MNGGEECPICTLYLRPGVSLKQHLDTHPKEKVIEALLRSKDSSALSIADLNSSANSSSSPIMPNPCSPISPQMTTAVTYQQILTTNAAGVIVPQFLQVPTLVNPQMALSQQFGYAPTMFNPLYNPYVAQPYMFQSSPTAIPNVETADTANVYSDDAVLEKSVGNEGSDMDVSECSPSPSSPESSDGSDSPLPHKSSVIISRSRRSRSQSEAPSPPLLTPSPHLLSGRTSRSSHCSSSPSDTVSSLPALQPICKTEESVIVEASTSQTSALSKEVRLFRITETNGSESPQVICRSEFEKQLNESLYSEHEVVADLSTIHPQLPFNPKDSHVVGNEYKDGLNLLDIQDEYDDKDIKEPSLPKETNVRLLNFTYSDDEPSADYADLLPSASPRILKDLLPQPSCSNAFLELDSIRIFYNSTSLTSTSRAATPPSVIQLADPTKTESPAPLNITADESMPARGELSEQESLGADSAWGLFQQQHHLQQEVKAEPWQLEQKPLKCSACNIVFNDVKERRAHKLQFHAKTGRMFKCTSCTEVFQTLRERRAHMVLHSDVKPTLKEETGVSAVAPPTTENSPTTHNFTMRNCSHCMAAFPTLRELRTHLRDIHGEVRFKCEECEACFDDEGDYNNHLNVHPLKCPQCAKLFYRRANLSLHLKRHQAIKPFPCSLCPKSFITRQKLEEHVNGHAGIRPIKCIQCDKTFSRHSNLIQHRNMYHQRHKRKVRDYVCRCGEVFHSQRKLEWHKEIHDNKPKSCPYCSQKFIHSASVTRHVRRAHMPNYLPDSSARDSENVSCPICDRIYLRKSLSVHMRVHNGERPFQCTICSKQFTTKWNMELHQWTHQSRSTMPYKCAQCKSAFFRETDYLAHMNAHKNLKPFICNVCGQKFIRKYNCLRHQEEHRRAKRFACTVTGCGRTFHRSYYLKDHLKVHTGVRPHTCHICGKASSTKSNHNKHVRIHDTRELVNTEN